MANVFSGDVTLDSTYHMPNADSEGVLSSGERLHLYSSFTHSLSHSGNCEDSPQNPMSVTPPGSFFYKTGSPRAARPSNSFMSLIKKYSSSYNKIKNTDC